MRLHELFVQKHMKYKLVIFDFDGTLADTLPWFATVANLVADAYRFKRIAPDEIETLRGMGARQVVRHLGIPLWKIPFIARGMRRLTAQHIDEVGLFAGAERVLEQLDARGVKIALVTSNARANVQRVLGPINAARIDQYVCGVGLFRKSASFRKVLKQNGVQAHEALCIGDEIRDIEAAKHAQIPFGAVGWGFTHLSAFAPYAPAEQFASMDEIVARLLPAEGVTT